ncbi:MAG: Nudix family hydrolase [Gammaproteobacteria bacterium]|nr:Nudix family hydrolase [Gammaproteobacteria bacterium]MDH5777930.1 Nudix family hydrolase [Gammaproteobacteria bacterium]
MTSSPVHVAVGVIENEQGEILIARRPDHLHQGGLWEFPGGKVEADETVLEALQREFAEEVALTINRSEPLIRIPFNYSDKHVLLDVQRVTRYQGAAEGMEGQEVRWVKKDELVKYDFPAANRTIIHSINLPETYLITGKFQDRDDFKHHLINALRKGIKLVQLRLRQSDDVEFLEFATIAKHVCAEHGARLLLNTATDFVQKNDFDGVHLNSHRLMQCDSRPIDKDKWLAASVHNEEELEQANVIEADFIVVSPVLPTPSHPGEAGLGWDSFHALAEQATMPVYALGGMSEQTIKQARDLGAQGIAGISNWW